VSFAQVTVAGKIIGKTGFGVLVFLGVTRDDTFKDVAFIADKIANLRIFSDEKGKMNLSVLDCRGEILLVSQFTLCADPKKGRRPSFNTAADPEKGKLFYNDVIKKLRNYGLKVETGSFGENMQVELINNGPVTIMVDSFL
jgi:D-tyrosyl-tRNA(Tyr) deacylase